MAPFDSCRLFIVRSHYHKSRCCLVCDALMILLQSRLKQLQAAPKQAKWSAACIYGVLDGILWAGAIPVGIISRIAPTSANAPIVKDCAPGTSRSGGLDTTAEANCKPPAAQANSSSETPYTIWVPGQPERTPASESYPANCQPLPSGVTSADWQYFAELYRCRYGDHD